MGALDAIVPGLGLATSVVGNVVGGIATANIAKKQQANLNTEKAYSEGLFNKQYYQDVLNRSENASMLRQLSNNQKDQELRAQKTAAITGATPEATAAAAKNQGAIYADAVNRMAGMASQRKDQALSNYGMRRSSLFNAQNNIENAKKQAWGQFMGNANDLGNASLTEMAGARPNETGGTLSSMTSNIPKIDNSVDAYAKMFRNPQNN